jgi:hypothetical protein
MQSQLFQGGSDQLNSVNTTVVVVALVAAAALLLRVWYWAKLALGSDTEPSEPRPARRWLLRPSNFLFVVGIAGVFYLYLGHPPIGPLRPILGFPLFGQIRASFIPAGILVLAFVLRHSENKVTAGFREPPRRTSRLDE